MPEAKARAWGDVFWCCWFLNRFFFLKQKQVLKKKHPNILTKHCLWVIFCFVFFVSPFFFKDICFSNTCHQKFLSQRWVANRIQGLCGHNANCSCKATGHKFSCQRHGSGGHGSTGRENFDGNNSDGRWSATFVGFGTSKSTQRFNLPISFEGRNIYTSATNLQVWRPTSYQLYDHLKMSLAQLRMQNGSSWLLEEMSTSGKLSWQIMAMDYPHLQEDSYSFNPGPFSSQLC